MDNRLLLHDKLISLVGTSNVYFQPPTSVLISYPCVIYNIGNGEAMYSNNKLYNYTHRYDLIFIYKKPTTDIIEKVIGELPMCSLSRTYISDNLNHYAFSVYF
jgi:hypothetical protein